jgi:hypothetical protein
MISGKNSEMKTTNKNEVYRGTNHTSNVSRPLSNETNNQCGGEHKVQDEMMTPCGATQTIFFMSRKTCGMSGFTKFYHPMLHKNNIVVDTVSVIHANKSQVIMRIVSVKIRRKTTIEF